MIGNTNFSSDDKKLKPRYLNFIYYFLFEFTLLSNKALDIIVDLALPLKMQNLFKCLLTM